MAGYVPPSLTSPLAKAKAGASGAQFTAANLGNRPSGASDLGTSTPIMQSQQQVNDYSKLAADRTNQDQASVDSMIQSARAVQQKQKQTTFQQENGIGGGPNLQTAPAFSGDGLTAVRSGIINSARSRLGTPYAWGGGGYDNYASRGTGKGTENVVGVDCSGLTSWVYSQYGIRLPRTSQGQTAKTMGVRTTIANARPGDLIGFPSGGHVAIYAGNGQMIESPKPGGVVRYRAVPSNGFAVRLTLPGD